LRTDDCREKPSDLCFESENGKEKDFKKNGARKNGICFICKKNTKDCR